MTANAPKRGLAALALVTALLAGAACSIDASTEAPVDAPAAASAAAPDVSTATTVLAPAATTTATTTTSPRPTATVDQLVEVEGGRLHVRCVGAGEITVVLVAGFNDGGDNWGRIEPALAQRARVCSSARFGTGVSDPPPAPQTFATAARDLHTLLRQIGEPGPYVVVGHSYGGAQAVTFAAHHPDEVEGLVLLDATPPTWTAAGCAVPDNGSEAAADFIARCPDPTHPTANPEQLDVVASFAEVTVIDTLGSLPLSVVTAAQHPFPGLDPTEAARLESVWNQGQEHWMSLSSAAQLVTVEDTGHYIHSTDPMSPSPRSNGSFPPRRARRRRHRSGGRPAAAAWNAAPSTSPSTPATRPAPRSTWRWLACRPRTRTPGSAP